jgi:hypothetical protein
MSLNSQNKGQMALKLKRPNGHLKRHRPEGHLKKENKGRMALSSKRTDITKKKGVRSAF